MKCDFVRSVVKSARYLHLTPHKISSLSDSLNQSEHKSRTLDPVFDATVDVDVQSGAQVVNISLWDFDLMSVNDFLGYVTLDVGSEDSCQPETLYRKELQRLERG